MTSWQAGRFDELDLFLRKKKRYSNVGIHSYFYIWQFCTKFYDLLEFSREKEDKLDLINPTTPSSTILPSASLGVATVNIDDCSDSETETEIKLEKVNIIIFSKNWR